MVETSAQEDTWIMCYGSNTPRQLCERIKTPYEAILERMCAVKLHGYKRGFCNRGGRWDNKSVATLYESGEQTDFVEGVAVRLTATEVAALDPFEGYPDWYNRENITLDAFMKVDGASKKSWTKIPAQAYI